MIPFQLTKHFRKKCSYDGASLDPQYKPPAYTGPEPTLPPDVEGSAAVINGGKTYHGSCHCGAITAVVKLPQPLEDKEHSKERIVECNCSICMRVRFLTLPRYTSLFYTMANLYIGV